MSNQKGNISSACTSRRTFLKASATIAGAVGLLGAADASNVLAGPEKVPAASGKLRLKIAGYKLDRVSALADGKVQVDGCETTFEEAVIGDINKDIFSGDQTWDVTEIGLGPFMLAYANEGFRDYSLLPIFPLRTFRHKSIFIRTDRGIKKPEDLRGKKIATPGFSSTSLTWIRGFMQDEYGVKQEDIEWVVSAKDSSADAAGKVSAQESMIPKGLKVRKGPERQDESDLLESGFVDALFHAAEPRGYVQGNPKIG
jgi:4,5-dihydroxyphthalate decarboxylase